MAKPRKIAVTLTLTVDPDNWELAYGEFTRKDVREYVLYHIQGSSAAEEECILNVELKGD